MLPTYFLQHALTMPQSYEYIMKLCKRDPEYCRINRGKLCKKILKLSNYRVFPDGTDYCKIYKELAELARSVQGLHKTSYISLKLVDGSINTTLLEILEDNASHELVSFLNANGYTSIRVRGRSSDFSFESSPTITVPKNSNQ